MVHSVAKIAIYSMLNCTRKSLIAMNYDFPHDFTGEGLEQTSMSQKRETKNYACVMFHLFAWIPLLG